MNLYVTLLTLDLGLFENEVEILSCDTDVIVRDVVFGVVRKKSGNFIVYI
jgi:hypothetical protein